MMKDRGKVSAIAANCKEAVMSVDALRFKNHVPGLIKQITEGVSAKRIRATGEEEMMGHVKRYHDEVISNTDAYWIKRRTINVVYRFAGKLGAWRLKHLCCGKE